jgi:KDO2-lipid IV(A) lauroyltransferase
MAAFGTTLARRLKSMGDATLGALVVAALKGLRLANPDTISNIGAAVMRRVGPLLREHQIGRDNLRAAFPEKSDAEVEEILRGVWENLGRVGAEFAHIDRLWDWDPARPTTGRIMDLTVPHRIAMQSIATGKPILCFAAHLANWEMPAVVCHKIGIKSTVLYRRPNLSAAADAVVEIRKSCMGTLVPTGLSAPIKLAEAMAQNSQIGLLVDQYYVRGVPVTFFGRPTRANPLLARLARQHDCTIHGIRAIRHPGNRFEITVTEPIPPARDAEGQIDIQGTMQAITNVVEGWVREHPEQWLWLHRRWRDEPVSAQSSRASTAA